MRPGTVCRPLHGTIKNESEKAVHIELCTNPEDDDLGLPQEFKSFWIPKSQVASISHGKPLDIIMASEWILEQKEIKHLASSTPPKPTTTPAATLADKLKTPPVHNFSDMDDDMPF